MHSYSRRQFFERSMAAGAGVGLLGQLGLAASPGNSADAIPFVPFETPAMRITGKVVRGAAADLIAYDPVIETDFWLQGDRATGYTVFRLEGSEEMFGPIADSPNPYVSMDCKLTNKFGAFLTAIPLTPPMMGQPEELPNFSAPLEAYPFNPYEEQTVETIMSSMIVATFGNPDPHTNSQVLNNLAVGLRQGRDKQWFFPRYSQVRDSSVQEQDLHMEAHSMVSIMETYFDPPGDGEWGDDLGGFVRDMGRILLLFAFKLALGFIGKKLLAQINTRGPDFIGNPNITAARQKFVNEVRRYFTGQRDTPDQIVTSLIELFIKSAPELGRAMVQCMKAALGIIEVVGAIAKCLCWIAKVAMIAHSAYQLITSIVEAFRRNQPFDARLQAAT